MGYTGAGLRTKVCLFHMFLILDWFGPCRCCAQPLSVQRTHHFRSGQRATWLWFIWAILSHWQNHLHNSLLTSRGRKRERERNRCIHIGWLDQIFHGLQANYYYLQRCLPCLGLLEHAWTINGDGDQPFSFQGNVSWTATCHSHLAQLISLAGNAARWPWTQ